MSLSKFCKSHQWGPSCSLLWTIFRGCLRTQQPWKPEMLPSCGAKSPGLQPFIKDLGSRCSGFLSCSVTFCVWCRCHLALIMSLGGTEAQESGTNLQVHWLWLLLWVINCSSSLTQECHAFCLYPWNCGRWLCCTQAKISNLSWHVPHLQQDLLVFSVPWLPFLPPKLQAWNPAGQAGLCQQQAFVSDKLQTLVKETTLRGNNHPPKVTVCGEVPMKDVS